VKQVNLLQLLFSFKKKKKKRERERRRKEKKKKKKRENWIIDREINNLRRLYVRFYNILKHHSTFAYEFGTSFNVWLNNLFTLTRVDSIIFTSRMNPLPHCYTLPQIKRFLSIL